MAEIKIIPAKDRSDEVVRTAAYARVSSSSENQLNSFAAQIRYYTELLKDSTDAVFVDMYAEMKIANLIQRARIEYQRKGRNKGFWHIQSDRKLLFFYAD